MPFAPYGMLFCSCHDVSYLSVSCDPFKRAQTQQSPIVVCSSFLTSSNMSKNFTEAEGRRYKGGGFHCPQPKLRFSSVSKKLRSRTVPYISLYICAPWRFLFS